MAYFLPEYILPKTVFTKEGSPMTNRIEYTDKPYVSTPKEDVEAIIAHLRKMNRPVTLDGAKVVLAMLIATAPEEWVITESDLIKLWPKTITKAS